MYMLVLFWDGAVADEGLPDVTFFIVYLVVVLHLGRSKHKMVQDATTGSHQVILLLYMCMCM